MKADRCKHGFGTTYVAVAADALELRRVDADCAYYKHIVRCRATKQAM
eukprot:CAMPEP_0119364332 /NCGR_PEP_ID=MMETSP1334-20130426/11250_1 /TAXON_ID=127549 /ORGANISM="Calcidiscus leptoporus, Strain RCC1130" /LENGTH=47 /DNA_ID= /DNA_START= /DNA_END= /DNA_ORIENTATION=